MASLIEIQKRMRILIASYAEKLPEFTGEIEATWKQLQKDWRQDVLQSLHRIVYELADSGASLGFSEVSAAASDLEKEIRSLLYNKMLSDKHNNQIDKLISELQKAATNSVSANTIEKACFFFDQQYGRVKSFDKPKRIFVFDEDIEAAQELALQLRYYDYEVKAFSQVKPFRLAVNNSPDAVIMICSEISDDNLGGIKLMQEIQRGLAQPAQVVFISAHDDFAARLGAVHAGSIAYFVKPINSMELVDKLDALTSSNSQESFRVLIVNGNSSMLEYYAAVLEQAGMTVKTELKAMDVIEALLEFSPDLILMDIYLPECNGLELTKVIRQQDNFVNIPIIYLAAENVAKTKLEAISLQGDVSLVKPIEPRQLVSAITSRVLRNRLLHSFMVRDGLTGLFNHSAIKEQLARELIRSRRLNTPLSFAIIDIDFFKKVNDIYGYSAGDHVIKNLARLLKQRLRETDIIGRYGGEEFAVIMTDTDAQSAAKVLNEIRQVFSRLVHLSDNKEFSASFSCGVADTVQCPDVVSICNAADNALCHAKQYGRNQVKAISGGFSIVSKN